jgi:hypothetical protein
MKKLVIFLTIVSFYAETKAQCNESQFKGVDAIRAANWYPAVSNTPIYIKSAYAYTNSLIRKQGKSDYHYWSYDVKNESENYYYRLRIDYIGFRYGDKHVMIDKLLPGETYSGTINSVVSCSGDVNFKVTIIEKVLYKKTSNNYNGGGLIIGND